MPSNLHRAAFALIQDDQGRVLFKKRRDFDLWDLPGGKAEIEDYEGEEWRSDQTCRREVWEETGCRLWDLVMFDCFDTAAIAHDIPSLSTVFIAVLGNQEPSATEEAAEFGWFSHADLPPNTFAIHAEILRQFEQGKVDRSDLRYLAIEQRRTLLL